MNNQVFFITSNQTKLDKNIEYYLSKGRLKNILTKNMKFKKENFTIKVFSFEIIKEYLKDIDIKEKKYKAKIELKQQYNNINSIKFEGIILFKGNRNNFIYDFEFKEYKGWTASYSPPIHIRFTKIEQLKIYIEALNYLKIKQDDKLSYDLIRDSQICVLFRFLFRNIKKMLLSKTS